VRVLAYVLNDMNISLHSETLSEKILLHVYYREEEILHGSERVTLDQFNSVEGWVTSLRENIYSHAQLVDAIWFKLN
jgi:hypothetical protein